MCHTDKCKYEGIQGDCCEIPLNKLPNDAYCMGEYPSDLKFNWEYEDNILHITSEMFEVSKIIDGVRVFPYFETSKGRQYLTKYDFKIYFRK